MSDTTQKTEAVHLDAKEADRPVVINPDDRGGRFVMSMERAIEACKRHESHSIVQADIDKLINHCRQWVADRRERISHAFIGPHESKLTVFIVAKTERFDFDLAEEVAQLSHDISRDFQAIWTDAVEVPNCDEDQQRSFIDPEQVMRIDG